MASARTDPRRPAHRVPRGLAGHQGPARGPADEAAAGSDGVRARGVRAEGPEAGAIGDQVGAARLGENRPRGGPRPSAPGRAGKRAEGRNLLGRDRPRAGALVFHEVEAIVHAVPEFEAICNVVRHYKRVEVVEGPAAGSKYESLSADARRAHGLSPTLWIYDELAQAKTRALLDNLVTAVGKRKASLGIIISTQAPDDTHPLSQLIDDAATGADPGVVSHVISAPMTPTRSPRPRCAPAIRGGRRLARPGRPDGGSRPRAPHPGLRAVLAQSAAQPALRPGRRGAAGAAAGLGATAARSTKRRWQGGRASAGWT